MRLKDIKLIYLVWIGTSLLIAALVLTWLTLTWWALGCLIVVGVLDLILHFKHYSTISQWVFDMFPKWLDATIMIVLLVFTWAIWGPEGFLPVLMGVIMGHIFWQE